MSTAAQLIQEKLSPPVKNLIFALTLIAMAAPVSAEKPKKSPATAADAAEPIVGRWKRDDPKTEKKEDTIWTFSAKGTVERHSRNFHEQGKWKKIKDTETPSYQCVMNGGAAVINLTYLAVPEHISLHSADTHAKYGTLVRLQIK